MTILRFINILSVLLLAVPVVVAASFYPGFAAIGAIAVLAKLRRSGSLTAFGTARWADSSDLRGMIE